MKAGTIFLALGGVAVAAVAVLLVAAAFRPDNFEVQRSVRIAAGAERIHPLINDLHEFNTWNPYNKKDPQIKGTYRGPQAGPGAAYEFDGNKEVGKGVVSIVGSEPQRVTMKLDMLAPMEAHNDVEFRLVPSGTATDVTWKMHGRTPYVGKVLHMLFDMDKMVGGAFEEGLAGLKARVEGNRK